MRVPRVRSRDHGACIGGLKPDRGLTPASFGVPLAAIAPGMPAPRTPLEETAQATRPHSGTLGSIPRSRAATRARASLCDPPAAQSHAASALRSSRMGRARHERGMCPRLGRALVSRPPAAHLAPMKSLHATAYQLEMTKIVRPVDMAITATRSSTGEGRGRPPGGSTGVGADGSEGRVLERNFAGRSRFKYSYSLYIYAGISKRSSRLPSLETGNARNPRRAPPGPTLQPSSKRRILYHRAFYSIQNARQNWESAAFYTCALVADIALRTNGTPGRKERPHTLVTRRGFLRDLHYFANK